MADSFNSLSAQRLTVTELIIETAPNLRTVIFGEIPNLHCENAPLMTQ
eukprot:COSAG02_NODE_737_length_17855_cov_18.729049_12_plen_48_part_00